VESVSQSVSQLDGFVLKLLKLRYMVMAKLFLIS